MIKEYIEHECIDQYYNYGVLAQAIIKQAEDDNADWFFDTEWYNDLKFMADYTDNHKDIVEYYVKDFRKIDEDLKSVPKAYSV